MCNTFGTGLNTGAAQEGTAVQNQAKVCFKGCEGNKELGRGLKRSMLEAGYILKDMALARGIQIGR